MNPVQACGPALILREPDVDLRRDLVGLLPLLAQGAAAKCRQMLDLDFSGPELVREGRALSLARQALKAMGVVGKVDRTIIELLEMLHKSDEIFSESEQIQLFQIIHPLDGAGYEACVYWFRAVKEVLGEAAFLLVSNPDSYKVGLRADVRSVILLLQWMAEIGDEADLGPNLVRFFRQEITLVNLLNELEIVKQEIEAKKYPEKSIEEVLASFGASQRVTDQFHEVDKVCKELKKCDIAELASKVQAIRCKSNRDEKERLTLLAIAREAIRLKFKIYPYNTQLLAILTLLNLETAVGPSQKAQDFESESFVMGAEHSQTVKAAPITGDYGSKDCAFRPDPTAVSRLNHPEQFCGRIAQVFTGEGKSTIIAMLAFYNACLGFSVDIISPSRYLAVRDYEKYSEFYTLFGITTSHICTNDRKSDNFKGQIIFGTNTDFEFAQLFDSIRQEKLRLQRPFAVVIVDEVDNLFIDTALNSARIAIPSRGKFGWVYQPILNFVRKRNLPGIPITLFIGELRHLLSTIQEGKYKSLVEAIADEKLKIWLESAQAALTQCKENHDYVVMPVEENTWKGKTTEHQIVLFDKNNTGRKLIGMHAGRGVHEFLEAKHNLAIHSETATPASLSHPLYFAQYQKIYGLTGTLGSSIEREELQKVYRVDTFDVPPHKLNIRKLLPPIICSSEESYKQAILQEIQEMQRSERPTLLLLESIQESQDFADLLNERGLKCQLLNERQAEHENFIIARAGAPKMITVATNTAGRGTDIILHPSSLKSGGLHVIFGFYPTNDRVEAQGFGRAGRQGQPGTGRMILFSKDKRRIEQFVAERQFSIKKLSNSRMNKIEIERINHSYLLPFLQSVQKFNEITNDDFIKKVKGECVLLLECKPKFVPAEWLEGADRTLSDEFLRFVERPSMEHYIEHFLTTAKHLLLEKILLSWAENFYGRLDELYRQELDFGSYRERVKALHSKMKVSWEKYLPDPEKGFWNYLKEISGFRETPP